MKEQKLLKVEGNVKFTLKKADPYAKLVILYQNQTTQIPLKQFYVEILKDHQIKVIYQKRKRKLVLALVNLIQKEVKKYTKVDFFRYTISLCYSHFPIAVTQIDPTTIELTNYLGMKEKFRITFKAITRLEVTSSKIVVESYNDVLTGSEVYNIRKLRYLTEQKNFDRRRFKDGFFITKEIIYKDSKE